MPLVTFAPQLQRHVPCPPQQVPPGSLDTVLRTAFMAAPMIERYVLDEQGAVRKHVAVFVNNEMIAKRNDLSQPLTDSDAVWVIQALSGG